MDDATHSTSQKESIQRLRKELQATRAQLKKTVEQAATSGEELKAANEELTSVNEELRSINEELRATTEELRATNEELVALNKKHARKIEELGQANSDLRNLMTATEIGTIFLSRDLCIKRFTPSAAHLFHINPADIGRPLEPFIHEMAYPGLLDDARQVLKRLVPIEHEARSKAGAWYLVRMRPYRTVDDRIDGVVLTFIDITTQKQAQLDLDSARIYAENIVNTVREPLVVLDMDLRVVSANQAFYDTFAVNPHHTEGYRIYELGNNQWDISRLRELLEEILPKDSAFNDFEVAHTFEQIGRRTMLLNARRIDARQLILLAIEDVTQQRQVETRLEQEKQQAQLYLDMAGVIMVVLDRQGHVTLVNKTGCTILDYAEHEVVGKNWFEHFVPARDRVSVRQVFQKLMDGETEAVKYFENAILTKNGGERLILWHNAILYDAQGSIIGTLGSGTDITERKQAEERNRFHARIFEQISDGVVAIDIERRVTYLNQAMADLMNLGTDAVLGHPISDLYAYRWVKAKDAQRSEAALQESGHWKGEVVLIRNDGKEIPAVLSVSNLTGEDGTRIGRLSIVHDITERKQAGKGLRESERRFRNLFDATPDAIFVEDLQGNVLDVNPAACRLHDTARDTLVGMNVRDLVPPDQRETIQRDFEKLINGDVGLLQAYSWTINQHVLPVEIHANRFVYDGHEAVLLIVRDISERRRLEHEVLRISEEERQRIGQDIHDQLASQFSGIALLSRGLVKQWKQEQAVSSEMLEEVAELARLGAEQARALAHGLNPVELDKEGLRAALKELGHYAGTLSGIVYSLDIDDALPPLESNVATQLYRIAHEAINNALKHAHAEHLALQIKWGNENLILAVRDDGVGLPGDYQERGGMGTHIMPYRARMIGATLHFESNPGEGTAVVCTLPLAETDAPE